MDVEDPACTRVGRRGCHVDVEGAACTTRVWAPCQPSRAHVRLARLAGLRALAKLVDLPPYLVRKYLVKHFTLVVRPIPPC